MPTPTNAALEAAGGVILASFALGLCAVLLWLQFYGLPLRLKPTRSARARMRRQLEAWDAFDQAIGKRPPGSA